jgi:hypothetical protein
MLSVDGVDTLSERIDLLPEVLGSDVAPGASAATWMTSADLDAMVILSGVCQFNPHSCKA